MCEYYNFILCKKKHVNVSIRSNLFEDSVMCEIHRVKPHKGKLCKVKPHKARATYILFCKQENWKTLCLLH